MFPPVIHVQLGQFLGPYDQKALSVPLFCRLRKVEGAGDNGSAINDHDLVMGKGLLVLE